jgi:hypothetical protein
MFLCARLQAPLLAMKRALESRSRMRGLRRFSAAMRARTFFRHHSQAMHLSSPCLSFPTDQSSCMRKTLIKNFISSFFRPCSQGCVYM